MWLNSFFTNPMNLFMILCFYCYNWLLVTGYWLLPLLTYFSQRRKDAKLFLLFFLAIPIACLPNVNCQLSTAYCLLLLFSLSLNVCKSGGRCKVFFIFHLNVCKVSWIIYFFYLNYIDFINFQFFLPQSDTKYYTKSHKVFFERL